MTQRMLMLVSNELLEAISHYYESGEYIKPFRSKDLADCVVQHSAAVGIAAMFFRGLARSLLLDLRQQQFGECM